MLPQCDVVTLHTPLTRVGEYPTYHLISEREVRLMKPGALLINAARGPVLDSAAVAGYCSEAIAEAPRIRLVTDTWEGEPHNLHPDILRLSEIATPHIAGYSLQGKQRATRMILESLGAHFGLEGVDVSDLPAPYVPFAEKSASRVTDANFSSHLRQSIYDSYDPLSETARLKADPAGFEAWRDSYVYRPEPPILLE